MAWVPCVLNPCPSPLIYRGFTGFYFLSSQLVASPFLESRWRALWSECPHTRPTRGPPASRQGERPDPRLGLHPWEDKRSRLSGVTLVSSPAEPQAGPGCGCLCGERDGGVQGRPNETLVLGDVLPAPPCPPPTPRAHHCPFSSMQSVWQPPTLPTRTPHQPLSLLGNGVHPHWEGLVGPAGQVGTLPQCWGTPCWPRPWRTKAGCI